jgi:O-antigen/teichoic acid export membrane protein
LNRNSEALLTIVEETARGAFYLFSGNVLATVLSAACGIAVARLLGPDLYGAYSLAFTITGFLMVFTGLGINSALTRYISHQYGSGGHGVLAVMIKTGTLFVTLESLLVYLLGYLFIKDLSAWLVNRPELADSALILLPIVVSQAIIAVSTGVLLGFRDAKRMAFISIAQQALRLLLAPLLVILGMGLTGALLGNTLAYIFSTVLAALYLYKYYLVVSGATGPRTRKVLFEMIMYGAPLYASGVVFTLVDVYRNALLSRIASDYVVGSFNAAYRFVTLITIITTPISTALFPAFSRLSRSSDVEDLRRMFTISAKYTSLVVAPVTVFAATMSREFVAVLFGRGYLELTPRFFALAALNYLYVLLGHMVLGSFFSGVGKTRVNLDMMLIYSAVFALLAPVLSSSHGADGLLYAIIVANGVSVIYALYIAYKEYRVKLEYYSTLGILIASLISAIPVFTLSMSLNVTGTLLNLVKLVVSGLLFLLAYSTLLPLLRVVSKSDVEFVVDTFSSIKILKPLVKLVAKYEEKLLSTRLVPYKPR